MGKISKYGKSLWACLWIALLCIILLVTVILSSCKILHNKKADSNDSAHVQKTSLFQKDTSSTGGVKTDDSKSTDKYEWWRIISMHPRGDTNVYNINSYPAAPAVIYEGGSGVKEEQKQLRDSTWDNKITVMVAQAIDSINRKISSIDERSKKTTPGVDLMTILLIVAGFFTSNMLLGYFRSNYKINKRSK
jgi:hypothetical protein